uniref:Hpc2-related domain-containing protein n=1 Tax=Plectus sambesii TaxID=2011161 RepID=A0A914WJ49_9BILA
MTLPVDLPGSSRKKRKALNVQHVILDLELFEPTKNKYPVFNYKDLLKEHLNQSDSSGDDERFHDREAEELVKRLEEKYGNKRDKRGKKIKFGRAEDFIDKTAGYDLSDSFIDDGEAYDEMIPSTLDTARKGFYVNRGKLEFKSVYSSDEENASDVDSEDERPSTSRQIEPKKKKLTKEDTMEETKSSAALLNDSIMSVINTSKKQAHGDSALKAAVQSIKKKRLSAGMPPTLRAAKAALANRQPLKRGPKPKNKNISALSTPGMTDNTAEMASFLAEMAGGNFNSEELENIYRDVNVSPEQLKSKQPANVTVTAATPTKKVIIDSSDEESSPNVTATPDRMSGGRPPTGPPAKTPQTWSNALKAMVKHFKDETRKFGAPDNKFRLHPEHVELCIKIEEKCISDGMNMPQKSAVMDSLARWVQIQKQSLYIRIKVYKERKASGLLSPQRATPPSLTSKNATGTMPTLSAAQKVSKPEKTEAKSAKAEKPSAVSNNPVRPAAPTPATSNPSRVKNDKLSVDSLIASVVASVASSGSSLNSPDSPSLRSIADVVDAVRGKERKQEASAASALTPSRPAGSVPATSATKTSGKAPNSAPAKQATTPTNLSKKANANTPPTSASLAAMSQSLTQDVMTNLALLTAVIKEQMEMQERAFIASTQMAIASNSPRPKKEFIWSDDLKKLVSSMMSMIVKATAALNQSPAEQATSIVRFFDVSVLPLFGHSGWMTFSKLIAQLQSMVPSGVILSSCVYYRKRAESETQGGKKPPGQPTTQQPKKPRTNANPTQKKATPLAVSSSASKGISSTTAGQNAQSTVAASSAPTSSISNGSSVHSQKTPAETSKKGSSAADNIQMNSFEDARVKLQSNLAPSSSTGSVPLNQSSAVKRQSDAQEQAQLKKQQNDRLKLEQLQKQRLAQEQLKKFQEDQLHKELEQRAAQLQLFQLQAHKELEVQRQMHEQQDQLRRRQQQEQQRQQQERQKQQEEQLKQRQPQEQQERQRQAVQQQQEEAQKQMLQILEQQHLAQEQKKQQELQEKQRLEQERKRQQQEMQEKQRLEQERRRQQQEQLKQQQELQEKQRLEQERMKQQQELLEKQRLEQERMKQQQELLEKQRLEQERRRQQQEVQEKQRLEQERMKQQQELLEKQRLEQERRRQQEQLKQQQQLQERARLEQEHRNRLQQQQQEQEEQLRRQQKQHQEQLQLQQQMQQQQLQYGSSAGRSQLGSSPGDSGSYSQHQVHQSPPMTYSGSPMGMPSSPTIQRHSTPVSQLNRPMMTLSEALPQGGVSPFQAASSSYSAQPSGAYYTHPPMQSLPATGNQTMNIQQQLMQLNERGLLNAAEMRQLMSGSMSMSEIQRVIYERSQQGASVMQQSQSAQQLGHQHAAFGGGNFYH